MKIYFHLSGRLGNQLFQWAYLHELVNQGHEIYLFTDKFHNEISREPDLNLLIAKCPHLRGSTVRNDLGMMLKIREKLVSSGKVFKLLAKILPVIIEAPIKSKTKFFPVVIDGFFVSKEWPLKYREVLCEEFNNLRKEVAFDSHQMKALSINFSKTIIHVRRGDLHNFKETFGVLTKEFYSPLFSETHDNLVLSDSIYEAKKMFATERDCKFVDPKDDDVWKALVLMSTSARVIMSNSTFSWWGGFFAANLNEAKVYIPKPFYRDFSIFDELLRLEEFVTIDSIFE